MDLLGIKIRGKWGRVLIFILPALALLVCTKKGLIDPTITDLKNQVEISAISGSVTELGIGGETSVISVTLEDGTGAPFSGGVVSFQSKIGSITPFDTSDASGIAQAIYISGTDVGTDTITASVTNPPASVSEKQIILTVLLNARTEIFVGEKVLLADGNQTAEITVTHKDGAGNPVEGKLVSLLTDFGTISPSVTTDFLGRATATYTAPPSTVDSTALIFALTDNAGAAKVSAAENAFLAINLSNISTFDKRVAAAILANADTASIRLLGIRLKITAAPDSINATGTTQSTITAFLSTAQDSALSSREIVFSTNFGTLTAASSITDGEGKASVFLQSTSATGVSTITATFALKITAQTLVNFTSGGLDLLNISIKANPTEILADGTSSSEITVTVKNSLNNPIQNAEILFKTSLGLIDAIALTNGIGVAAANLISERSDGIALITAELGGIARTTQVSFVGTQLEVTAQPEALEADGSAQTVIRISLRDGAGIPIESAPVTLQTINAVFSNDSTVFKGFSDVNGILIDSLKSGIQGVASVTVAAAGRQASTSIKFTRLVTTLAADTNSIAANDSVKLTFTIVDLDGSPLIGEQVLFFTNLGDVNPSESVTDANGQAFTYLSSTIGGVATISAKVTSNLVTPTPPTTIITIVSAPPANIRLIVDPVVVAVNGGAVELTAIVTDISGNPVADQVVSFKIVQGPAGGESIDPTFAITDATGSANSIFRSGSIGSKTVNSVILRATLQEVSISDEAFLTIAGEPSRINTSPSPPPVDNQDGTFSLAIGSIVSDINGNPVTDGTLVHYSTNPPIGVILSPIETENGTAATSLIYPTNAAGDNITIIASSREISDTLVINQLPTAGVAGFVDSLKIKGANDNSILADGESVTSFKVLIVDPTQNPVAGVIVDFTANPGNSGTGLTQDQLLADGTQNPNWGIATFALQSVSSKEDLYPAVTVSAGGRTVIFQENNIPDQLNPFLYRGISLTTNSERDTIKVGETVNIKALLKETTNNVALSSRTVTFGSSLGFIVNEETTNDRGEIEILFEAGTDSGLVKINATFGTNIKDSAFVYILKEAVKPPANIFLTADTSFIKVQGADGPNSTGITARITNADNIPVDKGVSVVLTTTLGVFASTATNTVSLLTDVSGTVSAQLQSGNTAGTAVITAVSGGVSATVPLVTFQSGLPDNLTVSADTVGVLLAGNLVQISVSALITDLNGNPVASGTLVSFSAEDDGSGDNPGVSIMSTVATDDFGIVTTTLTYTAADIGKGLRIRATAGGVSGFRDIKLPPIQ